MHRPALLAMFASHMRPMSQPRVQLFSEHSAVAACVFSGSFLKAGALYFLACTEMTGLNVIQQEWIFF